MNLDLKEDHEPLYIVGSGEEAGGGVADAPGPGLSGTQPPETPRGAVGHPVLPHRQELRHRRPASRHLSHTVMRPPPRQCTHPLSFSTASPSLSGTSRWETT